MLDKVDLRIGNWVQDEAQLFSVKEILENELAKDQVHRINRKSISAEETVAKSTPYQYCEPILLTPDIFKRIGAHRTENIYEIVTSNRRFVLRRYNNICFHVYQLEKEKEIGVGTVCSLHRLQNLIYFIANEELPFNEIM